jgi:lysophospholipase L1-like esterase
MKIANRGITGDTSRGLLVRLKEDVLALDPRAVVLMIGANDLAEKATGKIVFGNVMLIVEALKAHNPAMPIVLCETFPCAPDNYRPVAEIRKINALYAKTWSGDPQVTIVKTYRLFAGSDGASRSEYLPDRVHPNEAGYALWAGALRPVFARLGFGDPTPDPPSN